MNAKKKIVPVFLNPDWHQNQSGGYIVSTCSGESSRVEGQSKSQVSFGLSRWPAPLPSVLFKDQLYFKVTRAQPHTYWMPGSGVSVWEEPFPPPSDSNVQPEPRTTILHSCTQRLGTDWRHDQKGFETFVAVKPTVGYQDKQGALKIHLHPWKGMATIEDAPWCGLWCLHETLRPGPDGWQGGASSQFVPEQLLPGWWVHEGSCTGLCKTRNQDNIASFSGLTLVLSLLSLSSL